MATESSDESQPPSYSPEQQQDGGGQEPEERGTPSPEVPPSERGDEKEANGECGEMGTQSTLAEQNGEMNDPGYSMPQESKPCLADGGRILSIIYGVLLFVIAAGFSISEALGQTWLTSIYVAAFLAYMYGVSILFLLGLEIALVGKSRAEWAQASTSRANLSRSVRNGLDTSGARANSGYLHQEDHTISNGKLATFDSKATMDRSMSMTRDGQLVIVGDEQTEPELTSHRSSLFLRVGVAGFGIGIMIYDGLLLKQLHEHEGPPCSRDTIYWPHYIHLGFLFMQTYFIFKHSQVTVTSCLPLVKLGFSHVFVTNLLIALRAPLRQTHDLLLKDNYLQLAPPTGIPGDNFTTNITNVTTALPTIWCDYEDDIFFKASPYLFLCILQYSLLALGAVYGMYADTNQQRVQGYQPSALQFNQITFHKAHRGLFLGLLVFAGTCVSIILFFSYMDTAKHGDLPLLILYISDISLHGLVIIMVIVAWIRIRKLEYLHCLCLTSDGVLLLIGAAGACLFRLLQLFAQVRVLQVGGDATRQVVLSLCDSLLCVIVDVFQTSFIIVAFSRCALDAEQLQVKPGRGCITFLLITNIAMWLYRMFMILQGQIEGNDTEVAMYGDWAWQLIVYTLIPLLVFYHFQASSCLAHIWSYAYQGVAEEEMMEPQDFIDLSATETQGTQTTLDKTKARMRVIELKRRVRKPDDTSDIETIWTPVSEV